MAKAKKKITKTKSVQKKVAPKKPIYKAAKKSTVKKNSKLVAKKNILSKKPAGGLKDFITPLEDRVLIQKIEAARKTAGGLFIPDTVQVATSYQEGVVLSVGRGKQNKKGFVRRTDVQIGDRVLFSGFEASELKYAGQELFLVRETEILGIKK